MKKLFRRPLLYVLGILLSAFVGGLVGSLISSHNIAIYFPWNHPSQPYVSATNITSTQSNTPQQANVAVSATPDYKPAYQAELIKAIRNTDVNALDMFVEIKAADGYKFLPLDVLYLPSNISIEPGYEYKDTLYLNIVNFPKQYEYRLKFSICTDDINLKGHEDVYINILDLGYTR